MKDPESFESFSLLLSEFLLFFGIAGILVPLLKRLGLSSVLGYLICGILIGPYTVGLLANDVPWIDKFVITETVKIKTLGELGIIGLLFMIGLELSFKRLKEMRRYIFGLGTAQIMICAAVIFGVAFMFDNSLQTSILVGISLALSSTAIVIQLMNERHMLNRPVGRLSFSILLMQDLAVVPILILVGIFAAGSDGNILVQVGSSAFYAVIAFGVIYFGGKKLLRPALSYLGGSQNPEWLTAFSLFVLILAAYITHIFGLSAALGAFLAGLLIAETEFRHEIEIILEPLKNILMGIFFLSVGMMLDPIAIINNPVWIFASVIGILVIKAGLIFPLCLLFGVPKDRAAEASIMLCQPGEFALMILSVAFASQLLPFEDMQFFLVVTVLAMMITPLLFRLAPKVGYSIRRDYGKEAVADEEDKKRVLIAGFGRIGMLIGEILEKQGIPYIAVDNDSERVRMMRKKGLRVIFGDSRRNQIWRHLDVEKALAAVVTVDDYHAAISVIESLRKQCAHLPIIVRAHDIDNMKSLYDYGATNVIPETLESGLQIAHSLIKNLGKDEESVVTLLDQIRTEQKA